MLLFSKEFQDQQTVIVPFTADIKSTCLVMYIKQKFPHVKCIGGYVATGPITVTDAVLRVSMEAHVPIKIVDAGGNKQGFNSTFLSMCLLDFAMKLDPNCVIVWWRYSNHIDAPQFVEVRQDVGYSFVKMCHELDLRFLKPYVIACPHNIANHNCDESDSHWLLESKSNAPVAQKPLSVDEIHLRWKHRKRSTYQYHLKAPQIWLQVQDTIKQRVGMLNKNSSKAKRDPYKVELHGCFEDGDKLNDYTVLKAGDRVVIERVVTDYRQGGWQHEQRVQRIPDTSGMDVEDVAMLAILQQSQKEYALPVPHPNYVCYTCGKPGHFKQHCPVHSGLFE